MLPDGLIRIKWYSQCDTLALADALNSRDRGISFLIYNVSNYLLDT